MTTKIKTTKRTFWAVAAFYFLIAFEFFYMASPFAAYFYSVYRPALDFLDNYPAISWITGFFLPHLVEDTKSPLINSIPLIGLILATTGFLTFLICAGQVYYSKLFKKSVVTGGIYKYIRHPQYTAFAICSFGLMLMWPRYLVLFMFISMLFGYYFLAKAEEKECERKFGQSYIDYKNQTAMFFPFRFKPFSDFRLKFKPVLAIGLYILLLSGSFLIANGLKKISISNLYLQQDGKNTYLSILSDKETNLEELIELGKNSNQVDSFLKGNIEKLVTYVLPTDMYISEIPMQAPKEVYSHVSGHKYDNRYYKLVYTKANLRFKDKKDIGLQNALSVLPILEVRIDTQTKEILEIIKLEGTQRYMNISEPVF